MHAKACYPPEGVERGPHVQMHRHWHVESRRSVVEVNNISADTKKLESVVQRLTNNDCRVGAGTNLTSWPHRSTIQS